MKHITFYLDFISPYAWLAFEKLPEVLMGHSYSVSYKPVLFATLLQHHSLPGAVEIPGKREWTYRHVLWLAQQNGVDLQLPAQHPFNPLGLLRLALACSDSGLPNRYVCETIFRHVWQGGLDAADTQRLQALTEQMAPKYDINDAQVKARLRVNADEALAEGVFDVPTFKVDGKLFWGFDALPMLKAYFDADPWFENMWSATDQVGNWS